MNWEAIGTIAELIGAIAVVISLIYLASQVRSSSKTFKTGLRDTAFTSMMEWNYKMFCLYASQPGAKHYRSGRFQTFHPRFQGLLDRMDQPDLVPGHVLAKIDEPGPAV